MFKNCHLFIDFPSKPLNVMVVAWDNVVSKRFSVARTKNLFFEQMLDFGAFHGFKNGKTHVKTMFVQNNKRPGSSESIP